MGLDFSFIILEISDYLRDYLLFKLKLDGTMLSENF